MAMAEEAVPELAPVDYVVLEFQDFEPTGEGLAALLDLVDRGIIRILDLQAIRRDQDGTVVGLTAEDAGVLGIHALDAFLGASARLFTQEDFETVAATMTPGSMAVAILYENTWAIPFVSAVMKHGGEVIASGRVTVAELLAALQATEV